MKLGQAPALCQARTVTDPPTPTCVLCCPSAPLLRDLL